MRRIVRAAIVVVWVAMVLLLVARTIRQAPQTGEVLVPSGDVSGSESWMGVYHGDRKIGYTYHRLTPGPEGIEFAEASLLRLAVLDTPQTVRTTVHGTADRRYALRTFDFELSSDMARIQAHGDVDDRELRLRVHTGGEELEQRVALSQPLFLPATFRASLGAGRLQAGHAFTARVFDPATFKDEALQLTVEQEEPLPGVTPGPRAWRVREEFRGVTTTAWLDGDGQVLREQGPMGLTLIRESREAAMHAGWPDDGAVLDIVATASVPVARGIDDARERRHLRLRLGGIDLTAVPTDADQRLQGDVLSIDRPDVARVESYDLPYVGGGVPAEELVATPFIQSDHARIRDTARDVVGTTRDARAVAVILNDWVARRLRKVPTVSLPNALEALDLGAGDCNEHAVLFAALGRSVGLPVRVVAGTVYLDGAFFYHAWCEVWLGRWVAVDPALHQFPADATHVKLVNGGPEAHTALVGMIGRLRVEVLEEGGSR